MAVRHRRSGGADSGSGSRRDAPTGDFGWGGDPESEVDDIMIRRVLFAVLVAVVGCVGVWFVIDAVRGTGGRGSTLAATTKPYTICLMEKSAENERGFRRFADEALKRMGVDLESFSLPLPGSRVAICVGGFETPDCTEASDLLIKCRSFTLNDGNAPFGDAEVIDGK
jgi:hypothetical protein